MIQKNKEFILLGPQGSGKGTQAKILAERLGVPHISTGDMFRENIASGTDLGKQAERVLGSGQLMSDEITNQMIKDRLSQPDTEAGFILDGYPRNLEQAQFLHVLKPLTKAVCINLSDGEAVMRIAGRWMSRSTGAIYHVKFNPPPVDLPFADLIQRPDDTASAVRERLNIYHNETEPLLKFYKDHDRLIMIDGSPAIPQVTEELIKALQ